MLIVAIVLMEIVIVAIGVFMIWKPEILWKIENFLSVKGGEPTEFYLAMQRVGGGLRCSCRSSCSRHSDRHGRYDRSKASPRRSRYATVHPLPRT